jgi:hypothetical protein
MKILSFIILTAIGVVSARAGGHVNHVSGNYHHSYHAGYHGGYHGGHGYHNGRYYHGGYYHGHYYDEGYYPGDSPFFFGLPFPVPLPFLPGF